MEAHKPKHIQWNRTQISALESLEYGEWKRCKTFRILTKWRNGNNSSTLAENVSDTRAFDESDEYDVLFPKDKTEV